MRMQFALLALCLLGCAAAQQYNSPVFVWGGVNSLDKPSISTVKQNDFAQIMSNELEGKTTVVFLENELTNQDFLCSKSSNQQSCFAQLQQVASKTYYPSVENPLEALRAASHNVETNSVGSNGKLANALSCDPGKLIIVTFDDIASEERVAALEAHDAAIAAITKQNDCDAVYMYMSSPSSGVVKSRVRRDTAADETGNIFRIPTTGVPEFMLFYTTGFYMNSESNTPTNFDFTTSSGSDNVTIQYKVTLTGTGQPLSFYIGLSGGYFNMSNVQYNDQTFRSTNVYAPTDFSFSCGNLTLQSTSTNDYLQFNSFQMQAFFSTGESAVFGDGWDCLSFFSPGILMGLLVVALMLFITFTGACWMMDINTMDRFDDPKGKTITINAAE